MNRIVCVHVGTPKTGTTAIQVFLDANRAQLLAAGVAYPLAGLPPPAATRDPGHHLLPRELAAAATGPALDAVLAEVLASGAPSVVLSSEEFHAIVKAPGLGALARRFCEAGYTPVALVYLRDQASYAESLYVELLKSGYLVPFESYLGEILRDGSYRQRASGQVVEFLYSRFIADLEAHFGAGFVVVRSYERGADAKALPLDVLEVLGRLRGGLQVTGLREAAHANPSLTLRGLVAVLQRFSREPLAVPVVPDAELDKRFSLLVYDDVVRFYERFAADNRDVNARFGTRIPLAAIGDVPPADDPRFARARLHREILGAIVASLAPR